MHPQHSNAAPHYNNTATQPAPAPRSEIDEQTERLHDAVSAHETALANLGQRLSPLIRPIPVGVSASKPAAESGLSPLAESIRSAAARLESLTGRVREALETLAV